MSTVIRKLTYPDGAWIKVELPVDADGQVTIDVLSELMTQYGSFELSALPDTDAAVIKQQKQATTSYVVIDRHTGLQVGHSYATRARAARRVDALDNAYGAYRYCVRAVSNA